jgi:hypothetical protein
VVRSARAMEAGGVYRGPGRNIVGDRELSEGRGIPGGPVPAVGRLFGPAGGALARGELGEPTREPGELHGPARNLGGSYGCARELYGPAKPILLLLQPKEASYRLRPLLNLQDMPAAKYKSKARSTHKAESYSTAKSSK